MNSRRVISINEILKKLGFGFKYFKPYLKVTLFLLTLNVCSAFFDLLCTKYSGQLMDYLLQSNFHLFMRILCIIMLFSFVSFILKQINSYFSVNSFQNMCIAAELSFFSQISNIVDLKKVKENKSNFINTFQSDISTMLGVFMFQIPTFLLQVFSLLFISISILSINVLFFFIVLITSLIPVVMSHFFGKKQQKLNKEKKQETDEYLQFFNNSFDIVFELAEKQKNNFFKSRLSKILDNLKYNAIKSTKISILNSVWAFGTSTSFSFLLYALMGIFVLKNQASIGSFMVLLLFSQKLKVIVQVIAKSYQSFLIRFVSFDRVMALNESQNIDTRKFINCGKNIKICLNNLYFSYPNSDFHLYVDNITITGPCLCLLKGENGSGKTTLLEILLGIHNTDGAITFYGISPNTIYYFFQTATLFKGTIRDNLLLGSYKRDNEIYDVLKSVGIYEKIFHLPSSLDTVVSDDSFSRGEVKRLLLARALLQNFDVLLIDEIENSIDLNSKKKILSLLKEVSKKKIVILVSHDIEADAYADRVFQIRSQNIVEI